MKPRRACDVKLSWSTLMRWMSPKRKLVCAAKRGEKKKNNATRRFGEQSSEHIFLSHDAITLSGKGKASLRSCGWRGAANALASGLVSSVVNEWIWPTRPNQARAASNDRGAMRTLWRPSSWDLSIVCIRSTRCTSLSSPAAWRSHAVLGAHWGSSCAARPLSRWTRPCTRLWMRGPCNGGPAKRLKACGATRLAASRYLWRAVRPRMATCRRPSRKRCCSCTAEPASLRRLQERRTLQVREPTSPAECRALDQRGRKRWRPGTMRRLQRRPGRHTPPQTPAPPEARSHARGRLGARVAQESLHAAVASRPDARAGA